MIAALFRHIAHWQMRLTGARPVIIVRMDGGICSQMQQYLMGHSFYEHGYEVRYDLSFYDKDGRDMNGLDDRSFTLLKVFPKLPFTRAPFWQKVLYRRAFRHVGRYPEDGTTDWIQLRPPVLLDGYYADCAEMYADYTTIFQPNPACLDTDNLTLYHRIEPNAVAVHIRRGDLSHYTEAYGHPATPDYFVRAVQWCAEHCGATEFYLFSDDAQYVSTEILPLLPPTLHYTQIHNSPLHGYYDLMLMSRCTHHITSKGSLAKFAACMQPNSGYAIVLSDDRQLGPLEYIGKKMITL
ncbi:MAG: alpha-1,2-fucosyltransferase [Bacteroidales bacterium]|nr:alpha-1,2-fucosyltransferase [Bacteroidales bacterium]